MSAARSSTKRAAASIVKVVRSSKVVPAMRWEDVSAAPGWNAAGSRGRTHAPHPGQTGALSIEPPATRTSADPTASARSSSARTSAGESPGPRRPTHADVVGRVGSEGAAAPRAAVDDDPVEQVRAPASRRSWDLARPHQRHLDVDLAVVRGEEVEDGREPPRRTAPGPGGRSRRRRRRRTAYRRRKNGCIPVDGATVEEGLRLRTFWAIDTAGPSPVARRTFAGGTRNQGEPSASVSRNRRRASL